MAMVLDHRSRRRIRPRNRRLEPELFLARECSQSDGDVLESDSTATARRERKEMFPGISLGCWLARWHQGGGGGPWRGGRRAVGLGRCSPSANIGGGEMSRAVCLRLLIGRQCFDVQRDSARAQAAAPIVGEIVKSHLVLRAFSERP